MREWYLVMAILLATESARGIFATRKKERIMVSEGGEQLPASSYVFLIIQYTLRVGLTVLAYFFMPLLPIPNVVTLLLSYAVVIFVARVIEVGIRTGIVMYLTKKYVKQSGLKPDPEKETV